MSLFVTTCELETWRKDRRREADGGSDERRRRPTPHRKMIQTPPRRGDVARYTPSHPFQFLTCVIGAMMVGCCFVYGDTIEERGAF
jgi:hypothetical protein